MGFIEILETPYQFQSCISDRWDWRVEFSGECLPGYIRMGRHLVIYGGVTRADGYWQPNSSGTLTITPLRTSGVNSEVFTLDIIENNLMPQGIERSWFIPGMIHFSEFTEEITGEYWVSGMKTTLMDIPKFQVNWDVQWDGNGPRPLVYFFDRGQKFIAASGVSIYNFQASEFSTGTLTLRPKNISWQPVSITINENWASNGVFSCNSSNRVGWLSPEGQFTLPQINITGGF